MQFFEEDYVDKRGVISLGEAFIDYISIDDTNKKYERYLGGATVNVAAGVSQLGIPSYYLCKLGTDDNSRFVEEELRKANVRIEYCVRTPIKQVCGVYVHLTESGEREFHSYHNPTPDEVLTADQLDKQLFKQARMFYFGSGTLFLPKALETTEKALEYSKEAQTMVAFDVNLRLKRWTSEDHCRKTVQSFLSHVDIVKVAEEELCFLTKTTSLAEGIAAASHWKIPYLFITLGSEGAYVVAAERGEHIPGETVQIIDTTGAGDAFMAALLGRFHEKVNPTFAELREYTKYANHIGALATTKVGSLTDIEK